MSGLDFTLHTSMDLCIMGALLNAFAHEVMGSDDFYSCFYDFLLMYQFLCTYVCRLLFNIWLFSSKSIFPYVSIHYRFSHQPFCVNGQQIQYFKNLYFD